MTLLRHNIRRIFLVKWTGWRIVVTMLYMDCMYRLILKFFKQAGELCYFLNGSFYELANPLCLWISGTEIVLFMCIFCVYRSEMLCMHVDIIMLHVDINKSHTNKIILRVDIIYISCMELKNTTIFLLYTCYYIGGPIILFKYLYNFYSRTF